jgi:septal ring factor EnvC (AmiA/AmiB activator)
MSSRQVQMFVAGLAALASVAAGVFVFVAGPPTKPPPKQDLVRTQQINKLFYLATRSNQEIDQLTAQVDRLSRPSQASRLAATIDGIQRKLKQTRQSVTDLGSAVLDNPAKAVRVTLLQRDLKNQAAQHTDQLQAVRADIDRQYDLMKWVIGTLALGIVGMLLTVIVPALRSSS